MNGKRFKGLQRMGYPIWQRGCYPADSTQFSEPSADIRRIGQRLSTMVRSLIQSENLPIKS